MEHIETGSFTSSEVTEGPTKFRVVSWNIARGSKLNAVIEFLATADPDIIFLQEADKSARRTNYWNVAKEIAQKLKMNYVFGANLKNWQKEHGRRLPTTAKLPSRAGHCPIARSCASAANRISGNHAGSFPASARCRGDAEAGWHS